MLNSSQLRAFRSLVRAPRGATKDPEPTRTARIVCIASGKGGTGKSVLATNLASLSALRGERVLLVDFDAGLANAHLLLGLLPEHDLGHVLDGSISATEAVVRSPEGLGLLSGGVGRHALANPTRRELDRLFRSLGPLEACHDLVLIDHGAGMSYSTVAHLAASRALLLVTTPEVTGLSDAYAIYKRALSVNPDIRVGLVVNQAQDERSASAAWERFQSVATRFLGRAPERVGWVPRDPAVTRSVEARRPVTLSDPECEASLAIRAVVAWGPLAGPSASTGSPGDAKAGTGGSFYERARRALR